MLVRKLQSTNIAIGGWQTGSYRPQVKLTFWFLEAVNSTVLSLQEVLPISEGAEREHRDAKVGGWETDEGAGFSGVFVSADTESESWERDMDSWCELDGISTRVHAGGFCGKLAGESCWLWDELSCVSASATALSEVQDEILAGRFGKSLEIITDSRWVAGEISLPARGLSEGLVNPITWQRVPTVLTRASCWILSLVFSSWSWAKASARGATWVAASSKRTSTCFPKALRSLWISLTAHCSINSNFLLHKGSSSSTASSWVSKSPIISSRPDSVQALSGLPRASAASEAGRKSRSTPGMAKGIRKI